ncbi:uncharacterized protein N7477_009418 [Penicillium maclennaniae]|uniref:uncharacterized protein n=1 Tax=Penicillium maclennaniae TaxID=1343394 RepID=UPI0025417FB2|nr:uncharacterized protein N7477_009418 [Penicillium maclennaniae]KAJ5661802.1 hypothetical protein N7477_009418 [Penicillium maclennaniae]
MAPVGPRVSKEEFMHALNLNAHNPQDEHFYRAMRDEAIIVYNRMNQDTSYLVDSVRADPNTRPRSSGTISRYAIMEIWRNASPMTRRCFDQGGTNGEYGPNWVAGWLLYSVFRSRDVRNNRNRRKGESGAVTDGKKQVEDTTLPKKGYYDPVRNGTL